ncbi:acyl-CoA N-acyltransferase [Exidia glandulosa HHB12029]|uniref:Acyl-CoA N-acyltransferase n=1 Tax=Exidia glandulosa HHB12029 TaxID=1314781 RepID=A0A165L714_EXIGL|nr:acyl-CoA N-acyltransferase [Exidia glandulosa HHB12029]
MVFVLETARLYITPSNPWSLRHCAFFLELWNCSSWLEWIGDRNIKTGEVVRDIMLHQHIPHYHRHGFGYYVVSLKSGLSSSPYGARPVGVVSLLVRDGHTVPDVGFAFLDETHGMGYATEAARALVAYAAEHCGVSRVIGMTAPDNEGCLRTLRKLGLHVLGVYTLAAWPESPKAVLAPADVYDIADCGVVLVDDTLVTSAI